MGAYEYIEFNSGILLKFIKKFLETALHLILPLSSESTWMTVLIVTP